MKNLFKEFLFRVIVIWSIFNFYIAPSYGGKIGSSSEEEGDKKSYSITKDYFRGNYDKEIISYSRIERKIKERDSKLTLEPSLKRVVISFIQSGYNTRSLTCEDVGLWTEGAAQGHFAALYNLGWFLHQRREKEDKWDKEIIEILQRVGNKDKEMQPSILEKSKEFYLAIRKKHLEMMVNQDKSEGINSENLGDKQDYKEGQTYLEYLAEAKEEIKCKTIN